MSHEVTIKPTEFLTCVVELHEDGDLVFTVEDDWNNQNTMTWFKPEQWDRVVEAMAKARKEQEA